MLTYTTHMTHEEQAKSLTPVQKRFCQEYVIDWNGAAAYMRASGMTNRKTAGVSACKLLKMPKVKEYYEAYAKEILGPLEKDLMGNVQFWIAVRDGKTPGEGKGPLVVLSKVLELLEEYGLSNDKVYEDIAELHTLEVAHGRVADKLKASEYLSKYRAMFVEKKEIEHSGQVQIIDDIK